MRAIRSGAALAVCALLLGFLAPPASARAITVSVTDTGYSPQTVRVKFGKTVTWDFDAANTSEHSVTGKLCNGPYVLFDSGVQPAGQSFGFTFWGSGTYPYDSSVSGDPTSFAGKVKVPLQVSPSSGTLATTFTLTYGSEPAPTGFNYVVGFRVPGGTWDFLQPADRHSPTQTFVPGQHGGAGTYEFKSAIFTNGGGSSSCWSPTRKVSVTT